MLNKIRKDIYNIFNKNDLFLVNSNLFITESTTNSYHENTWEFDSKSLFSELKNVGLSILFYGKNPYQCSFIKQYVKIIEQNDHRVLFLNDIEQIKINSEDYLIATDQISDKSMVAQSSFSITSYSSPLELKMISNYVSNFNGEDVFEEIGNLLVRSRSKYNF